VVIQLRTALAESATNWAAAVPTWYLPEASTTPLSREIPLPASPSQMRIPSEFHP